MSHIAAVAAGGALGGSLRWAFIALFPVLPGQFPWVVFAENLAGALALGLLLGWWLGREQAIGAWRPFLATGVLGSFTTFSNYTLDMVRLAADGAPGLALAYAAASVVLGLLAAVLGLALGQALGARAVANADGAPP